MSKKEKVVEERSDVEIYATPIPYTNILSAERGMSRHKKLKSFWSDESRLSQKVIISILARLEEISDKLNKSEKQVEVGETRVGKE